MSRFSCLFYFPRPNFYSHILEILTLTANVMRRNYKFALENLNRIFTRTGAKRYCYADIAEWQYKISHRETGPSN
ncbi:Phenylalanine--tRNA ligase beta subunit [Dirofilaria immitis]